MVLTPREYNNIDCTLENNLKQINWNIPTFEIDIYAWIR